MSAIIWLPEALDDLSRVYTFLESKNPDAAARAVQVIFEAADRLAEHSLRCLQPGLANQIAIYSTSATRPTLT